nr:MAG TPA: DNA cytosine methyltransferase [Caudoviricetes sp.]
MKHLIVDNFAGGGGASTGIEMAIGRSVDIAINHDPDAIAMHKANHPHTKHYCEDVWQVDPVEACDGNPVALAWFSPDCKHFSRAKGGKPVDKNIRGLAWVAIKWAALVKPKVIMLENVPEIQTWGPLGEDGKPIKERAGETFDGFISALTSGISIVHPAYQEMCDALSIEPTSEMAQTLQNGLGYEVQYRTLKSCDYGAPTTRTRFYMIARCDGRPIVWPEPTHAPKDSDDVKQGRKLPYHTAAECIDWSIPAQSIFERKKPLAENTLRRIARGIQKFVIDNPEPFIVTVNHSGEGFRGQSTDEPLGTITAKNGYGVVMPTIMCNNTNNVGASVETPLPTVTTGNRNYLVAPSIVPIGYGEREGQAPRVNTVDEPLGTIVSSGKHYLVAPTLIQYHSETAKAEVRGQELTEPLMTQDTSNRYALSVAHIMKNYGGGYNGAGSAADAPLDTVTAKDHNSLVTAHIMTMRNNMDGQPIDEPLTTISCSGAHHAEVQAFLVKYFSNGTAKLVDEPLDTVTTKDRFALVTIHGEEHIITDIKMRMLQPRELFNAQGFPPDYIIDHDADGHPYVKSKQVARCGNAVTPPVPAALVRANLPEEALKESNNNA